MENLKMNQDPFCWICCDDEPADKTKCAKCIRSFHDFCLTQEERENIESNNGLCMICIELNAAVNTNTPEELQTLSIIMKIVFDISAYNALKYPQKAGSYLKSSHVDRIVNPLSLMSIRDNIDSYKSFAAFLSDFKWIQHNCVVLYAESHEKTLVAKNLLNRVNEEIESVKKCAECYINANNDPANWFIMACSKPHLILWAKMKGFNYWPAKLMSIDGQLLNVRFFGDHTHADVPATNCFLYSTQNPDRRRSSTSLYNAALKEARAYTENIRDRFGSFEMTTSKIPFDPNHLDKYIQDMIPGRAERRGMEPIESSSEDDEDQSGTDEDNKTDSEDEKNSTSSAELAKSIPTGKSMHVSLERIDGKQTESGRCSKRSRTESIGKDKPSIKLVRLSESNVRSSTVDLNIEPNNGHQNIKSDLDGDVQMTQPENSDHNDTPTTTVNHENGDQSVKVPDDKPIDKIEDLVQPERNDQMIEPNNGELKNEDKKNVDTENETKAMTFETKFIEEMIPVQDVATKNSLEILEHAMKSFFDGQEQLNHQLHQALKEAKFQAIKEICEYKDENAELKEKVKNSVKSYTALKLEFDTLHGNFDRLKHTNTELEQMKGKHACNACGKIQDDIFHCSPQCFNQHVELMMKKNDDMSKDKNNTD